MASSRPRRNASIRGHLEPADGAEQYTLHQVSLHVFSILAQRNTHIFTILASFIKHFIILNGTR